MCAEVVAEPEPAGRSLTHAQASPAPPSQAKQAKGEISTELAPSRKKRTGLQNEVLVQLPPTILNARPVGTLSRGVRDIQFGLWYELPIETLPARSRELMKFFSTDVMPASDMFWTLHDVRRRCPAEFAR